GSFRLARLFALCSGGLFGAGARENALQAVIPLLASVLEEGILRVPERDHRGPRFGPRSRIIYRNFPLKSVNAGAREPLNDMQFLSGNIHEHAGLIVGRIDD